MGSPLRLTLTGPVDAESAEAIWAAVRAEFEAAEAAMSRFREASDLTVANRAAGDRRWLAVDPRLRRALVAADRAGRLTDGRFDPRVIGELERLGYRGAPIDRAGADRAGADRAGALATGAERTEAGRPSLAPGGRRPLVEVDRAGRIRLEWPVDLGGIGKGLALRWAGRLIAGRLRAERLRAERLPAERLPAERLPAGGGALLEAGGDLIVVGAGPVPGEPWRVDVEDPLGGEALAVIDVASGAVATSSVAVNRWVAPGGGCAHHLLDPATGAPGGGGLLAVTVAAPDAAWAEVRTKQLFLAGPRTVGPLARALDLAAWWVEPDGRLGMTPAARQRTAWLRDEATG
jgi:thiamine biosynthesis lipoprotein